MGFGSSINFRLTGSGPVRVCLAEVAQLLRAVDDSGLFEPGHKARLGCVFGDRFDRDITSMMKLVAENPRQPNLLTAEWMPMDLDVLGVLGSLAAEYRADDRSVYRAWVRLGTLLPELRASFTTVNPDPNDLTYFRPESISFSIDPWSGESNQQNANVVLGYLSLAIHGDGLFFPRTAAHYIHAMTAHPPIAAIARACETIWPSIPQSATDELIEIRQCMGANWSHPLDAPTGWHWMGDANT